MNHRFLIADVFAEQPFGGNQLAVFPDARGLSTRAMQALAREFNFAETTFVFPPVDPRHARSVRIFTPKSEVPFAGHPTIGTAAVLAHLGEIELSATNTKIVLEENIGPVRLSLRRDEQSIFAELSLEAKIEMPSISPARDEVAAVLSLDPRAIIDTWFAGLGIRFCYVQLQTREDVDHATLDGASWARTLREQWSPHVYFFAGDLGSGGSIFARMFAPAFGIDEDPATGSASAILVGTVASRHAPLTEPYSLHIEQGTLMGRPSRLHAFADSMDGRVDRVRVGGLSWIVADGTFAVPDDY